jgi:hypothetical protein
LGRLGQAREGTARRLSLSSFKIRFHDRHVRAVVKGYDGPGVDLRGDAATQVIAAARPMIRWLEEREPGVDVRSISVNDARILVSLESEPKPRALRIEDASLRDAGHDAEALITELAEAAIARRV